MITPEGEEVLARYEDSDEAKVNCMNLAALAINSGWSFAGVYFETYSAKYKATFRRFVNSGGRRRRSEEVSGFGESLCAAIVSAAQGVFEDE